MWKREGRLNGSRETIRTQQMHKLKKQKWALFRDGLDGRLEEGRDREQLLGSKRVLLRWTGWGDWRKEEIENSS